METTALIQTAPIISRRDRPQPYPQEWDCGCITDSYIADEDTRHGERPFQMRLTHHCGSSACKILRSAGYFPWGHGAWIYRDDEGTVMSTAEALADIDNGK